MAHDSLPPAGSPLARLLEFLRFPSVSTDPTRKEALEACARWLCNRFEAMGLDARVCQTPGHPVVFARNAAVPGRPTVLLYGHYDVQPEDPVGEWTHPPFDPVLRDGVIYARGSADNKGQILAHVEGVAAVLKEKGELPVNLVFLVEGEEEIGSNHLEAFLREHREELRCDIVAVSDTGMVGPGVPTFTYGLRGIAALELKVRGAATDLHSGIYGGAVRNPAVELARLLATLHGEDGRVAVPGFYDGVVPVTPWEREAWGRLPFGEAQIRAVTGVEPVGGEAGLSVLERIWGRPTAEVNGLGGGFQGEGTKTVIPREAFAKLTFRLVPGQEPARVLEAVARHLQRHCPEGVRLELTTGHTGEPYLTDVDSPFAQAARRALARTFPGREVALIREGGSIPIVNTFKRVLGVETLLLGLALPDCRAHAPDENFPVANFEAGMVLNRCLLEEIASGFAR